MQNTLLARKGKIFGLTLLLMLAVALCFKFWPKSINAISKQSAPPRVENKTESLRPVKIEYVDRDGNSSGTEIENGSVRLQIKNTSTKAVIGYVLTFGERSRISVDLLIGGIAMQPGETRDENFGATELINPLSPNEKLPATIALVVFDDHTSEGDFKIDNQIRDRNRGVKAYLQLVSQTLSVAQTFSEAQSLSRLSDVRRQLSTRYEQLGDKQSESFKSGLSLARNITGSLFDELNQWEASGRKTTLARAELHDSKDANEGVERIAAWAKELINKY